MTSFFEQQEQVLRRSRRLGFGFSVAAFAVCLCLGLVSLYALSYLAEFEEWDWLKQERTLLALSLAIPALMLLLSALPRARILLRGPGLLLRELGGIPLDQLKDPLLQKRLRNLVEEMAIASGVPTPALYLLDEDGINACAVGLDTHHAAIGITRGAARRLNRDELQAILAHEFSHIVHGDIRLNTRMLVWMAGLFGVFHMGKALLTGMIPGRRAGPTLNPLLLLVRAVVFFVLGFSACALGAAGWFCGKLLQRAASRQREFLADASAVQYTRDPDAVARALSKLGPDSLRARLINPCFLDMGHMLFADHQVHLFTRMFSSHPPLISRILAVQPKWDGVYPPVAGPATRIVEPDTSAAASPPAPRPDLAASAHFLNSLPESVQQERQRPEGARALVLRLLLADQPAVRDRQIVIIEQSSPEQSWLVRLMLQELPEIPKAERFPLLDLCLPRLTALYPAEQEDLLTQFRQLMEEDGTIDLCEFALYQELLRSTRPPRRGGINRDVSAHRPDVSLLLSLLSRAGAKTPEQADAAFEAARKTLNGFMPDADKLSLLPPGRISLNGMQNACQRLSHLAPGLKERLLRACEKAILADGTVHEEEYLGFRAAAALLNVPVSPLLSYSNPDPI